MRRIRAALLIAAALAATTLGTTGAPALECVGVQGVVRYCPGKVCVTEPCYVVDR